MIRRPQRLLLATVLAALSFSLSLAPTGAVRARGAIRRSPDFRERVGNAIERGADWVRAQQLPDGSFGTYNGYPAAQTALAYHTLRVCGVPRSAPDMQRAYESLRREYVAARDTDRLRTYTAALVMMAIESHGWPERRARDANSRYAHDERRRARLDEPDTAWMQELVRFVEGNQNPIGAWRYGSRVGRYAKGTNRNPVDYDHSNTQYALLGLKAASRSGVEVNPKVYLKALKHLLGAQQASGPETPRVQFVGQRETFSKAVDHARGWSYFSLKGTTDAPDDFRGGRLPGLVRGRGAYGSMTAGSLGALVICRSELLGRRGYSARLDARAEQSVWDGIAWLGRHFSVTENPERSGWHYYYLYALERAGVLAGVDWMGEQDWYGRGADFLLVQQRRSGSWSQTGPRILTTCFALLFLKRGTIPVQRGAVTPSGGAESIDFSRASSLSGRDLEDLVDLVVARWRRAAGSTPRADLSRGLASAGGKVVLPLLRRMATGDDEERPAAHSLAVAITGQTFFYDAAASAEERADQLMAWEEWYMARADRLRYDAASGRLVTR